MLEILLLTLQVASLATVGVLVPSVVLGYALARFEFPGKRLISAVVGLPLVLPPTAVGFLLLRLLAVDGPLGRHTLGLDLGILLTWKAAVLAAAVMSLPLVVRTVRVTFESIDPQLEHMARTLGYGPVETFLRIVLPLSVRGLVAATILGFTRAVGEFGATVTIAGNIPGRTQTLASAIFSAQQVGDHRTAHLLMIVALLLGLVAIWVAESLGPGTALGNSQQARSRRTES
ncbi:MAG: molybdate ABC transporter permease subunit [Thermoanaerobaculia bacterium]|nr:molybdate ABC transporter permease subunit [Thermoanaerobaculia bacterium]